MPAGESTSQALEAQLIAAAIRRGRTERFWTQRDLAKALTDASDGTLFVAHSSVNRWEKGHRRPSIKYLGLLVEVLDLDLNEIRQQARVVAA